MKKRYGDRKDGRRLRSLDPFYTLMPYIMKERNDASNYFTDELETSPADKYILNLRAQGYKGVGLLHLFLAGYVRCVSQFPALNRFVSGRRLYARNEIEIAMTIKKKLSIESGETAFKVTLLPTDTIREIYDKINIEVAKIKDDSGGNSTEDTAAILMKIPRLLLRICIRFLTWLDYHGHMPSSIIEASPFHASIVVTDLGSLGIRSIYHHLYNFGNVPIFLAFGAKRKKFELDKDGLPVERKYIDYSIVCDERICDGHYYATAFRHLKYYLKNPALLDSPPENVVRDVD